MRAPDRLSGGDALFQDGDLPSPLTFSFAQPGIQRYTVYINSIARMPIMSPALAAGTAERDWGAELYQRHRTEQTLLYRIVEQHYPPFVTHVARQERPLPDSVQREFDDYLRCGRLEHGFLRVHCDICHAYHLVAFSCKRRAFCPSCAARRMVESAALLVDEVFPEQPARQWGEGRPFVQWTNAARRTAGLESGAREGFDRGRVHMA